MTPKTPKRWIRTPADERWVADGGYFDPAAAVKVCRFFPTLLRHSKGTWARQPFELLPWQADDILAPVFGWKRADGLRRFRTAYIEVPKKNGKSTFGAGLGIYMTVADGEGGAEVYSCATKQEQAMIVHSEAVRMVAKSPDLLRRLKLNRATKVISFEATESKYAALASDSAGSEGINPHCLIIDELHAWRDRAFWDTLRYGNVARTQPITFILTTAGVADKTSVGWEQHEYARKVLAGVIEDPEFFAYMRAADPDDDVADPAIHAKANPSYGVTIQPAEIAKAVAVASEKPSEWNTLLRYRFNLWVEQSQRWIQLDKWDAGDVAVDRAALKGRPCWGGLDLATVSDLAAFALVFPDGDGQTFDVLMRCWVPKDGATRRQQRDSVPYLTWGRGGHIELTKGEVIDYGFIRKRIIEDAAEFDIREIAFDPYNATQLAHQLTEDDGLPMVSHRQGFLSMSEPSKRLEREYLAGNLRHGGHPVLRWAASNVAIKVDPSGNIKPDKDKSTEKIDPIVALIMALGRATLGDGEPPSVYGPDRGLLSI